MTLGERLQQLRKAKQMSQEELGNLLLVSRQTVSLWENNQTVPTVDNLIRLKEIFGVSIDSILTGEEITHLVIEEQIQSETAVAEDFELPKEKHSFSFDKNELKLIYKIFNVHLLKRLVIWLFLFLLSTFPTYADTSEEQNSYFVVLFAFIFLCISLVRYIQGLFATKKCIEKVCYRSYTYEIFQKYILVRVLNSCDEIKTQKVYFNEFKKCWETPYCYFLEHKDKTYFIIKKSSLSDTSHLDCFCRNLKSPKTDFGTKKITLLKTAGSFLFFGCFLGLIIAMTIVFESGIESAEEYQVVLESCRCFHYFLPIPLLSIIVGILLNKNNIRNKRNVICGIIIGFIMLIYGFFPSIFSNIDNNLNLVEAQLGFEFPEIIGMNYNKTTNLSGEEETLTTLSFAESVANDFEKFMQEDSRWLKGDNKDFEQIIPEDSEYFPVDFFLVYNKETSEFGKIPKKEGIYQFIYIAYSSEMNVAYIYEYPYVAE
ncbi:MAG: helix-turn-helix transcriptional regulator [Acutalibacteraceae bacterium]|nr:helix-turn-helix transcriptional regulator [Acutalibacteraceae bacterium]